MLLENIKDEITFRKHSKSPVNVLQRLKHGIHVLVAYYITREVKKKEKKKVFWRQLKHKWMGKVCES